MDVITLLQKGVRIKNSRTDQEKLSYWQLVFSQSKVNGAIYAGDKLPGYKWTWPKDTYLQRRLHRNEN
jgi:hypothetical protein